MATRMQQRRGTAAQWTDADPILASGEIGFESDTNQFKIGDGVNHWSDLSYFKNLQDLGGSLDDYILLTEKGQPDGVAQLDENGKIPSSQIPDLVGLDSEIASSVSNAISTEVSNRNEAIADAIETEVSDRNSAISSAIATEVTNRNSAIETAVTNLEGEISTSVADAVDNLVNGAPAALDTLNEIATVIGDSGNIVGSLITNIGGLNTSLANHGDATENVHGITDTAELATNTSVTAAINDAVTTLNATIDGNYTELEGITNSAISDHNSTTTNVHGIDNTALLATKDYADDAVLTHANTTENVHGIANFADLASQSYADDKASDAQSAAETNAAATADSKITTHNNDTTGVHGIANTADLALLSDVSTAVSDHNLETTSVHGIADTALLATKAYADQAESDAIDAAAVASENYTDAAIQALTKSSVGLGNVDNTSDANKPVSTATQTALDAKASLSGATFTGAVSGTSLTLSGNLTVNGTTTTVNTTNFTTSDPVIYLGEGNNANSVDLGFVASYNDGTYAHQGLVKDSSDSKWKLFKGVTDEPTTTVNFGQGSLDTLAVGALEATTVTPSSGIVFSDGTQTKAGVPSITTIATAISSSATLAAGEQDKFVPLTGAVTITLPATGYSTGQSIDFYQASGTGAAFASTNGVVGTPGLKFRTTYSVVTAMKISGGWLVFGDLSA